MYYNVFRASDYYFYQVLENPNNGMNAADFSLKELDGVWQSSIEMSERVVEVLMEDVLAYQSRV